MHGGRVVAQPAAAALGALDLVDQVLQPAAQTRRESGRLVQRRIESLVLKAKRPCSVALFPGRNVEPRLPAAVHDHAAMLRAELIVGHVGRDTGSTTEGRQHPPKEPAVGPRPKIDRPTGQRALRIVQQRGRMGPDLGTQPFARRAPAERAVERKMMRRKRLEAPTATVAGKVLAMGIDRPLRLGSIGARVGHAEHAPAQRQGVLDAVGDARPGVAANDHAIDHHLDRVMPPAVDRRRLVDRVGLAVDPQPHVARAAKLLEKRLVHLAWPGLNRGHEIELRAGRLGHDLADDLVGRLGADRHVAVRTIGLAEPREENPQIVVDLGHRADRTPRAVAGPLLFDGDRRRKALDVLELRLGHLGNELPGIGAEAFDVAALALGINRVHRQRRLARSAHPATHGHSVARNVDVDPFQVMLLGAADADARGQPCFG